MTLGSPLIELFLDHLPLSKRRSVASEVDLTPLLLDLLDRATAAWPDLSYAKRDFVVDLAERLPSDIQVNAYLQSASVTDLYLACACQRQDQDALSAFEETYLSKVEIVLRPLGAKAEEADEVKQILRQRFFVGSEACPPAISKYSGRGSLHRWVRISAMREYYRICGTKRQTLKHREDERLFALTTASDDPEVTYMKLHFQDGFRNAFAEAMRSLTVVQRNVLRHRYLDGLKLDQIASLYGVHAGTISRWLSRSCDLIMSRTRRTLMAQLCISRDQCDSIFRLLGSQMDVSIQALLELDDLSGY